MKRADSAYPVQIRSTTEEFRGWAKHRFLTKIQRVRSAGSQPDKPLLRTNLSGSFPSVLRSDSRVGRAKVSCARMKNCPFCNHAPTHLWLESSSPVAF